jgi:hypothetical protein
VVVIRWFEDAYETNDKSRADIAEVVPITICIFLAKSLQEVGHPQETWN